MDLKYPTNSSFACKRLAFISASILCLGLASCAAERQQSTSTPGLETGITANNGGGTRTLNNNPNMGVTTRVAPR